MDSVNADSVERAPGAATGGGAAAPAGGPEPERGFVAETGRQRLLRLLSFRNISAIYIFIALFALFSFWVPDTFLQESTWKALIDSQALTAMVAVALVIPVAAGAFDLAIGTEVGLGGILAAWLLSSKGLPIPAVIVLTIIAGCLIGLGSGLLITKARITTFIATLGVSSILAAVITWVSGGEQILNLGRSFQDLATTTIGPFTYPVYIMLIVAAVAWYLLERTAVGRYVYATGGNPDSARLAGVNINAVTILALVACGGISAAAGVLLSSSLGTGDPTTGPAYLLPAFSAVFLGSTQFRGGRFNVWGTVVAVFVLATGVKGLQLAGAPVWIPELFNGAALLLAVGLANFERSGARFSAIRRLIPGLRDPKPAEEAG
jgi:ribose transport system permease protein